MSDIAKNPIVIGAGCGLAGLFVGAMLATATLNTKVADGVKRSVADMSEAMQGEGDAVAALSERIEALEASIAENSESVAALGEQVAGDVGSRVDELGARVSEMSESLSARIEETSERVSQTASEQAERLESALAELPARAQMAAKHMGQKAKQAAQSAGESVEGAAKEAAQAAGLSGAGESVGDALGVGQTAVLAEGAVRAFVQQYDAEAGTAVLSVNRESSRLSVGESVIARHDGGACSVGVGGVTEDGVQITSDCDLPEGSEAMGETYGVGSVALMGDGNLRVFVSGILGGDVRLAINGLETEVVSVGDTVEVETSDASCSVTVTGIRDRQVAMTGSCG